MKLIMQMNDKGPVLYKVGEILFHLFIFTDKKK